MKINIEKIIILGIWAGLFIFLYKNGLITTDSAKIRALLGNNYLQIMGMFVLISVTRVLFFIPGVAFMVLGGLCFGPGIGFLLSMLSIIISETVIFIIGRYFAGTRLKYYLDNKHRDLVLLTDKYGYEFMSLGIICPVAPTDVVCLIASLLEFDYKRYILTVIIANAPMMMVYSYLGNRSTELADQNVILFTVIGVVLVYTMSIWFKIKSKKHW